MAGLASLLRVRRHEVEERQKVLAGLYAQANALATERARVVQERAEERVRAAELHDPQVLGWLAAYEVACASRISGIDAQVAGIEAQIAKAQERVRAAFAELKKIEIIAERRAGEGRAALKKADSQAMDEAALEIYRRRGGRKELA